MEAKIDGLSLLSQALWELVRAHAALTEDDLRTKVAEKSILETAAQAGASPVLLELA